MSAPDPLREKPVMIDRPTANRLRRDAYRDGEQAALSRYRKLLTEPGEDVVERLSNAVEWPYSRDAYGILAASWRIRELRKRSIRAALTELNKIIGESSDG